MATPTQYQVIPPVQNTMGGAHLHTPSSIFQHMMAQQNAQHQPGNWSQIPQVPPMYMPWSVPSLQQPQLVRFTGEGPPQPCELTLHQKRKLDYSDLAETQQTKQFISEEKMAAHFRDMHISSNYSPNPVASRSSQPSTSTATKVDIDVDTAPINLEDGKSMHPRLVISEELKRLQNEPLLPASLLSKLERPSMALVLWEPPSKHLRLLSSRQESLPRPSTSTAEEDNNNNNINNNDNEQILNINESLEPMDL